MNRLLLVSAIAALPFAASAADLSPEYNFIEQSVGPAVPQGSVFAATLEGYAGYTLWSNVGGDNTQYGQDQDYFTTGGSGRVNIPLLGGMSAQLDVDGEYNDVSGGSGEQYVWSVLGAGHLNWRDPTRGLLGIFGGGGYGDFVDNNSDEDFWFAGVEAQAYFDRVTLYGQLGYFDAEAGTAAGDDPKDPFRDAWFVRGVARYFVNDNTFIQGEASYADGVQDDDSQSMYLIGWGARAEQRLAGTPVSLFVNYEGTYYDNESHPADGGHFIEHIITGGVSLQLGTGTSSAIYDDRHGVTLDVPAIGRWTATGNTLD